MADRTGRSRGGSSAGQRLATLDSGGRSDSGADHGLSEWQARQYEIEALGVPLPATIATDATAADAAWEYGGALAAPVGTHREDREAAVTGEELDSSESLYFREVRRHRLLTAQQEVALAETREEGEAAAETLRNLPLDHPDRERLAQLACAGAAARARLMECNLRLVIAIARRYTSHGVPLLDLIQEGNIGLHRAITKYDPRTGYRFSTYAYWWIRQAVTRALAEQGRAVRLPFHIVERLSAMRRSAREFEQRAGRWPTAAELAERLGLTTAHVEDAWRASRALLSLDAPLGRDGAGEDFTLGSMLSGDPDGVPEVLASQTVLADELDGVLRTLTPRERFIIRRRFGLDGTHGGAGPARSLAEVAYELGVSRERVRQLENEALAKLRASPEIDRLRSYAE